MDVMHVIVVLPIATSPSHGHDAPAPTLSSCAAGRTWHTQASARIPRRSTRPEAIAEKNIRAPLPEFPLRWFVRPGQHHRNRLARACARYYWVRLRGAGPWYGNGNQIFVSRKIIHSVSSLSHSLETRTWRHGSCEISWKPGPTVEGGWLGLRQVTEIPRVEDVHGTASQ
jgi:hypothetical protein